MRDSSIINVVKHWKPTGYRLIKHLIGGLKLLLGINKRCSGEAENIKAIWTKCASALYRHKKVCDERITGRLKQ